MEGENQVEIGEVKVKLTTILECDPNDMECQRNVLEHLKGLQGALEDERAPADLGDLLQTVRDTISKVEIHLEACTGDGEEMPPEVPAEQIPDV